MNQDFLDQLKQEAHKQATLNQQRLLPAKFDWLTSFIGTYPWQTVLVLSLLTSLLVTGATR